ncbi:MAG: amino acid racemase [archaeon]|nr:amino acid racemase [archaeon]MCR4323540.1 amino acid racemase [Nanoarchaeota archaeon]
MISNVSFPKYLEEEIGSKGGDAKLILPYLLKSVRQLESAGADFIVLPCNTLHSLMPTLKEYTSLEFVDLVVEVSREVRESYRKIGVLCTSKTRKEKIYDSSLKGVKIVYPGDFEQEEISRIILRIINKTSKVGDREYLERVIENLLEEGAEKVLLACTDLGNLVKHNQRVLDTTDMLIETTLRKMKEFKYNKSEARLW